jgi:AcrR family transcriptional regulator
MAASGPSKKPISFIMGLVRFYHGPAMPSSTLGGVKARAQAVRDQILRTAADLFRERGYRATTLDEIAGRLRMSKASVYRYFRAKEELLAAISRETIEAFTRELDAVLRADLAPEEKLRRVVRNHVRAVIANRSFLTVFFSEEANLPPRLARAVAAQKDGYDKGVEGILRAGARRGVFRDVPPRLAVYGILGMLNWLYKWYRPDRPWDAEEVSRAFLMLIEGGLLRSPGGDAALARRMARLGRELGALARQLDG